ncbi:MAG: hypothetical protein AVDCRST_MAG19-4985, partial [uncultured Thermomicrobiales bacterium]
DPLVRQGSDGALQDADGALHPTRQVGVEVGRLLDRERLLEGEGV